MKGFHYRAAILVGALVLAGCSSPVTSSRPQSGVPEGAKNSVTISIDQSHSRSGLIDVATASLRSDLYDIILYNATNTYRILVTNIASPAVLTNIAPGTYSVLVLAGKTNGATLIGGTPAAILLGSGDVPYVTNYATNPLTGTLTNAVSPTDGRGVTVAAAGNTAVSVTLQNLVYSITGTNATGTNPFAAVLSTSFSVDFNFAIFTNLATATNSTRMGPIRLATGLASTSISSTGSSIFTSAAVIGPSAGAWGSNTFRYTYTAPASVGTGTYMLFANPVNNYGVYYFYNELAASPSSVLFSSVTAQSGTVTNWFVPTDALTVAMPAVQDVNNVAIPGAATVNFSAPGAAVTIAWGAGL